MLLSWNVTWHSLIMVRKHVRVRAAMVRTHLDNIPRALTTKKHVSKRLDVIASNSNSKTTPRSTMNADLLVFFD